MFLLLAFGQLVSIEIEVMIVESLLGSSSIAFSVLINFGLVPSKFSIDRIRAIGCKIVKITLFLLFDHGDVLSSV